MKTVEDFTDASADYEYNSSYVSVAFVLTATINGALLAKETYVSQLTSRSIIFDADANGRRMGVESGVGVGRVPPRAS